MGLALLESYRYHLKKKAGFLVGAKEFYVIMRLITVIFFTSYMNFNHLQYNTDLYIRKYGYLS